MPRPPSGDLGTLVVPSWDVSEAEPHTLRSRFPVETTAGERVWIVRDEIRGGLRVLIADDGRHFTPAGGLKVRQLAEPVAPEPPGYLIREAA